MDYRRGVGRRRLLKGALGLTAGGAGVAGIAGFAGAESNKKQRPPLVYTAVEGEVDLGGRTVSTWSYNGQIPGKELRVTAGEEVNLLLKNRLSAETTMHWHGLRIANDMDGVPGVTQAPVAPGEEFHYRFTPPDAGTYWFHSHGHLQLDRGLLGALIVEDPQEKGDYDDEWVIVLDDWVDGTGRTPEDVFHHLKQGGHDDGEYDDPCLGYLGKHIGDVHDYPHFLINGRTADAPSKFEAKPKQRIRLRIINAGADTMFRVALAEHEFKVTHTDGFPVEPQTTSSLFLGMGERVDAIVELGDGVFPLVASAEGKDGSAMSVVRTGGGPPPKPDAHPAELDECPMLGTDFTATDDVILDEPVDRSHGAELSGDMMTYVWKINGASFGDHTPLGVSHGEGVELTFTNTTMMPHPMHLHGHTFQVLNDDGGFGPRKDTAIVPAGKSLRTFFVADNPGDWVMHCHNEYHMAAGMMTTVEYDS